MNKTKNNQRIGKIVIGFICIFFMTWFLHSSVFSQVLPVHEVIQEQDQWCWAATSKAVLDYYGSVNNQCAIAEYTRTHATWHNFGTVNCCTNASQGCNYWNYMYGDTGSIEEILQNWGVSSYGRPSAFTQSEAAAEIAGNRPFIIRWGWTGGGGHFLVGHGIENGMLHYMNPWFGEGMKTASYAWVVSGADHTWTHTSVLTTNHIFTDVPPSYWAYVYIMAIYNAGYTTGYGVGTFAPELPVTREQMAAFIIRAKDGEPPTDYCSVGPPFPDCSTDSWSCKYIKRLSELGLTTGYGITGLYMPALNVTRAQMAAFMVRAVEGEPVADYCSSSVPFTDVTASDWSCIYIKRLYELNITTGYGDGRYGPDDLVTRAQMAVFLGRAFLTPK